VSVHKHVHVYLYAMPPASHWLSALGSLMILDSEACSKYLIVLLQVCFQSGSYVARSRRSTIKALRGSVVYCLIDISMSSFVNKFVDKLLTDFPGLANRI